ncbi:hypothetical protein [Azospirillum doebereinerae]
MTSAASTDPRSSYKRMDGCDRTPHVAAQRWTNCYPFE